MRFRQAIRQFERVGLIQGDIAVRRREQDQVSAGQPHQFAQQKRRGDTVIG
jgi:hypothetical protein